MKFLQQFLDQSPTAWHACKNIEERLQKAGYKKLVEGEKWDLKPEAGYFVTRNGGSIIAFLTPKKRLEKVVSIASHTDSPALKLKPKGEFVQEGATMLHFEVYGAPILATYIGRDLYLAGRIFYEKAGSIQSMLVDLSDHPFMIPNLALHLDRDVNEKGLVVQRQDHLAALVSAAEKPFLEPCLKKKVPGKILYHELYATSFEKMQYLGLDNELIASARLDNLAQAASNLESMLAQKPHKSTLKVMAAFNYEEIGSMTQEGAASSFFSDVISRLVHLAGLNVEEKLCLMSNSVTISCDVSHAVHPNHTDKHDARHRPKLGEGPIIKTNAQCRYVTDGSLAARIVASFDKEKIPYQFFSCRNDIPCGSTIGPIHAAKIGFATIDLGIPLLGMHSCRELIHKRDYQLFVDGISSLFDSL